MNHLSRRTFIKGVAAMPLALWLARNARASDPVVRSDIACAQGAAMLEIYANAVTAMQAMAPDNPLSWTWQWYTHFVDGLTTKANEITRIFGPDPTPMSSLANEMWNTCQSHAGQNYNNFLPWHRMYTLFMENIVRQVSGRPEFAMPYWNYTSSDPLQRGVVPLQFRLPGDPVYGCLYRADRSKLANTGQPIQKAMISDPMDISDEMAALNYSTAHAVKGFCPALNGGVHGSLHVLVGTRKNMGAVPYAGRDPLFFVHHSTIDRMWASWNANGGVNPTTASWANASFVFADGAGQRVSCALKDYFDIAALGYSYDTLIPPATMPAARTAARRTRFAESLAAIPQRAAAAQSAELGAGPVRVKLVPVGSRSQASVLGIDPASPGKRTYLVLKNLHTWKQPEVLYAVYLTPADGPAGPRKNLSTVSKANFVGHINFFDAEFHDHGHGAMGTVLSDNFYSFDVTDLLLTIARMGNPTTRDSLLVTFVPEGTPAADARPLVATAELVLQ